MNSQTITNVALVVAVLGLVLLFYTQQTTELSDSSISKITGEDIGEMVTIKGTVTKVSNMEKVSFITIEKPESITVVVFDNISVNKGSIVSIMGRVEEYDGEMEIIAEEIIEQ